MLRFCESFTHQPEHPADGALPVVSTASLNRIADVAGANAGAEFFNVGFGFFLTNGGIDHGHDDHSKMSTRALGKFRPL